MNTEQRKALEKIVYKAIEKKRNEIRENERKEEAEAIKENEKKNGQKAERLWKEIKELEKQKELKNKEIKALGFSIETYGENRMEARLTDKDRERIDTKSKNGLEKIEQAETRLIAKVWGVETDFDSLMKAVEKELKTL